MLDSLKISEKAENTARLLNFLSATDPSWDPDFLERTAKSAIITFKTSFASNSPETAKDIMTDELFKKTKEETDALKEKKMHWFYANLCVRELKIILVIRRGNDGDSFAAWASMQAQKTLVEDETGKAVKDSGDVGIFDEYFVFKRKKKDWLLSEILGEEGIRLVEQENFDADSSPEQMKWYYTKDRAL
jgi:hypothetical protein